MGLGGLSGVVSFRRSSSLSSDASQLAEPHVAVCEWISSISGGGLGTVAALCRCEALVCFPFEVSFYAKLSRE